MSYAAVIQFLERHLLPCGLRQLTGFECPGCGMQRALVALLRGDFLASLAANPALLPLLATLAFAAIHLRFGLRNGHRLVLLLFGFTVSLMIVNYIVRSPLFRYL